MRKLALLVVLFAPLAAFGQGIISIAPQQCVWRAGDNPAWAAPNLNETGWQPFTQWKLNPDEPRIWVRCHADLSSLQTVAHPAVQVSLWAAYQLYLDGALTGSAGNLRSGNFSMNTVRSFPLPPAALHPATIALRVTWRLINTLPADPLPPLGVSAGDDSALRGQRAARLLAQSAPHMVSAICFSIVGILGLITFWIFLYDPSRTELFLLAFFSVCLACIYLDYLLAPALVDYPSAVYVAVWSFSALTLSVTRPVFFFALARRRVPLGFWILIAFSASLLISTGIRVLLPPAQALWLDTVRIRYIDFPYYLTAGAASTAPFFAFWPYSRIARRMRPLAGLCFLVGATVTALFAVGATAAERIPGIPDLVSRWGAMVSENEALVLLCTLAAIFGLLFLDQRKVAEERAILAGEMQAAREIQQMIAPAAIDVAAELRIGVAFYPMREVGGDFYQVVQRGDNAALVVIGDVSGKGLRAAMTGALAVGALRALASENLEPAALLARLNREMVKTQQEGFITCLCALVSASGQMVAANAGHLAPYCNGEELLLNSGLPLGVAADADYAESTFSLAAGDTLTFLSDGVVEARNPAGELFGFDRTRAISTQSAEQIAGAAHAFGQEDDITVLTLTFAPQLTEAGLAHA